MRYLSMIARKVAVVMLAVLVFAWPAQSAGKLTRAAIEEVVERYLHADVPMQRLHANFVRTEAGAIVGQMDLRWANLPPLGHNVTWETLLTPTEVGRWFMSVDPHTVTTADLYAREIIWAAPREMMFARCLERRGLISNLQVVERSSGGNGPLLQFRATPELLNHVPKGQQLPRLQVATRQYLSLGPIQFDIAQTSGTASFRWRYGNITPVFRCALFKGGAGGSRIISDGANEYGKFTPEFWQAPQRAEFVGQVNASIRGSQARVDYLDFGKASNMWVRVWGGLRPPPPGEGRPEGLTPPW